MNVIINFGSGQGRSTRPIFRLLGYGVIVQIVLGSQVYGGTCAFSHFRVADGLRNVFIILFRARQGYCQASRGRPYVRQTSYYTRIGLQLYASGIRMFFFTSSYASRYVAIAISMLYGTFGNGIYARFGQSLIRQEDGYIIGQRGYTIYVNGLYGLFGIKG